MVSWFLVHQSRGDMAIWVILSWARLQSIAGRRRHESVNIQTYVMGVRGNRAKGGEVKVSNGVCGVF